jgi:hypothetical protein
MSSINLLPLSSVRTLTLSKFRIRFTSDGMSFSLHPLPRYGQLLTTDRDQSQPTVAPIPCALPVSPVIRGLRIGKKQGMRSIHPQEAHFLPLRSIMFDELDLSE